MQARRHLRMLGRGLAAAAIVVWSLAAVSPLHAAKWRECPSPIPLVHVSIRGAVTASFVHPGHEIGIVLSDTEVAETGGFATAPGRNTIRIEFVSLFGAPIVLPSITAAAVSTATIYFTFPDTAATLGRTLAGPIDLLITTGATETAHIMPQRLVALPPATDVASVMIGAAQDALATLDMRGSLWIPIEFSGFGESGMPMPQCPSTYTPLGAFAVGVDVRANTEGGADSYPWLRGVSRADVYLGDFLIHGGNAYGQRMPSRLRLHRMPRGFGIGICGVNDALNLVLRVRGRHRWAVPGSPFAAWVADSSPMGITLTDVSADPDMHDHLNEIQVDAFGNPCSF